jgi:hypothetical protein
MQLSRPARKFFGSEDGNEEFDYEHKHERRLRARAGSKEQSSETALAAKKGLRENHPALGW